MPDHMLRVLCALLALVAIAHGAAIAVGPSWATTAAVRADVLSWSPTWATLQPVAGDSRTFTVNGCGFRTYSQVVCLWGSRWASVKSDIVSDTQITCEIPAIPYNQVETVPFWTSISLIFDGDWAQRFDLPTTPTSTFPQFRFGPICTDISPYEAKTGGGASVSLIGQGFNEFTSAAVWFDGVSAAGSLAATTISAALPSTLDKTYFNTYLMINVVLNGNPQFQVHCMPVLHLGPVFTTVNPSCGLAFDGSTSVTLSGTNFDDPAISGGPYNSPNVEVEWTTTTTLQRTTGTRSGGSVSVLAPRQALTVTTVSLRVIFEWSFLRIAIPFSQFYGTNPTATYGPSATTFAPAYGWVVNNNDIITLTGCGFQKNNFTAASVTATIEGANPKAGVACANVAILSDTQMTCVYPSRTQCTSTLQPKAVFKFSNAATLTITWTNTFEQRPNIAALATALNGVPGYTTGEFQRGKSTGGDTVTFTGDKFCRTQGDCNAADKFTPQCRWTTDGTGQKEVAVTAGTYTDTSISCQSPPGQWNFKTTLSVNWMAGCIQGSYKWHWGPLCWLIAPTFGYIQGGTAMTLTGNGFLDVATWSGDTSVFFCNVRLASITNNASPANFPFCGDKGTDGTAAQLCPAASSVTSGATSITLATPTFPATFNKTTTPTNINPTWSGIRLFGDNARLVIRFGGLKTQTIECLQNAQTNTAGKPDDQASNRWDYRWGPIVQNIVPHKAESGPWYNYKPSTLSVSGVGFSEPYIQSRVFVGISTTGTQTEANTEKRTGLFHPSASVADGAISFNSIWGGSTDMYQDVTVFFDTCNSTAVFTSNTYATPYTIYWGPRVTSMSYTQLTVVQDGTSDTNNPRCVGSNPVNIWGVKPWGGETVTITGWGFTAQKTVTYCLIDQVLVGAATFVSDTKVTCTTPARDYWTNATVVLLFGKTVIQGVADYTRALRVPKQTLNYRPCIEKVTSNVGQYPNGNPIGFASGGDTATIVGYGLGEWHTPQAATFTPKPDAQVWPDQTIANGYIVFFGNYRSGGVTGTPTFSQVVCTTPSNPKPTSTVTTPNGGIEFNTDVYVSLQLYGSPENTVQNQNQNTNGQPWGALLGRHTRPGVIGMDWKIWAPMLWHFGPVCTGVSPANGYIGGNQDITLQGVAIRDPNTIAFFRATYNGANLTNWIPSSDNTLWTATTMKVLQANWQKQKGTCDQVVQLGMQFRLFRDHSMATLPSPGLIWPKVTLPFIDVSVACPANSFKYGPVVTTWNAAWTNGWIGSSITISGSGFTTDSIGLSNKPTISFEGGGNADPNDVTVNSDTQITVAKVPGADGPDGRWANPYVKVGVTFANVAATCATRFTTNVFIYGPELCRLTPTAGYSRGTVAPGTTGGTPDTITFAGRGFKFDQSSTVLLAGAGLTAYTCSWSLLSGGATTTAAASAVDTAVTCPIALSTAVQNVATGSLTFNFANPAVSRTRSAVATGSTVCGAGPNTLTYYYGPTITASTLYSRIAGDTKLTIAGARLDDRFFKQGAPNVWVKLGTTNVFVPATITATTVTFSTILWGGKACLDTDTAQPQWQLQDPGTTSCAGTCACSAPTYCMAPVNTIQYGNPRGYATTITDGRVPTAGDATGFTVKVDPYTNSATTSCNPGGALGRLFPDNCENPWVDYLTADFATAVNGISAGPNRVLCVMGNYWSRAPVATTTLTGNTYSAVCPVPAGPFNGQGAVRLILAPKDDYMTVKTEIFRWVPWSDRTSTAWAPEQTQQTVVVYGGDWISYEQANTGQATVNCYFGGNQAVQSDLTDDYFVTCRTPQRGFGSAPIQLEFCDHKGDPNTGLSGVTNPAVTANYPCTCTYSQAYPDRANTSDSTINLPAFTFVGISGIAPTSGPIQGNTNVIVSGAGFNFLSGVTCQFGGANAARVLNNTSASSVTCTTPKASAGLVPVTITGTYMTKSYKFTSPQCYEFGTPMVSAINPTTVPIDGPTTAITLTGGAANYFNGGSTFQCNIIGTSNSGAGASLNVKLAGVKTTGDLIVCQVPARTITSVGSYVVEAIIDGVSTNDRMRIDATQTIAPLSFAPTSGSKFGGDTLTVTGNSLNGGLSYFCRIGSLVTAGTFTAGATNSTTRGNSTISAARRSDSIEERRRPFSMAQRSALRGVGDQIKCLTPPGTAGSAVPVAVSIDGGLTFTTVPGGSFTYRDVNPTTGTSTTTSSATRGVVTLAAVVGSLAALSLLL